MADVRDGFTSTQLPTSLRLQQTAGLSWRQPPEYIVMLEPVTKISLLIAMRDHKQLSRLSEAAEVVMKVAVDTIAFRVMRCSEFDNCRIGHSEY